MAGNWNELCHIWSHTFHKTSEVKFSQVGIHDTRYFTVIQEWVEMNIGYLSHVFTWNINWFHMWKGLERNREGWFITTLT